MKVVNILVYEESGAGRRAIFVDQITSILPVDKSTKQDDYVAGNESLIRMTDGDCIQVNRQFDEILMDIHALGRPNSGGHTRG